MAHVKEELQKAHIIKDPRLARVKEDPQMYRVFEEDANNPRNERPQMAHVKQM